MSAYARVYFLPASGHLRCMDLRRAQVQQWVNAAPTASEGRNIRRATASLIGALRQGEYLLDTQVIDLSNVFWHGTDHHRDRVRDSGEDTSYVPTWRRPSMAQVATL